MDEFLLNIDEFKNNPELSAQFGGDYEKYKAAFIQKLRISAIFDFPTQNGTLSRLNNSDVSIFGGRKSSQTNPINDKRFTEMLEKLDKIQDPKIRAQIEEELYAGNLSDLFFDMLMERYQKKKEEFEEVWEKYLLAKSQAANMKETCERLLKEYQASNDDQGKKRNYIRHKNDYTDMALDKDLLLDEAMMLSHRVV